MTDRRVSTTHQFTGKQPPSLNGHGPGPAGRPRPRSAQIVGWGMAVPERVVTNHDLEKIMDTTDEWIHSRTGIAQRRIASGPRETTASLAVLALSLIHI